MMTCEDALAAVSAMRGREATDYQCGDYIARHANKCKDGIDQACRRLMADWCLKVVDRCSFARDTASTAMNMLDRFLNTTHGEGAIKDRNLFQLASMTCLYTAIKIYEPEALQPQTIVQLSRGMFTVKQVEEMELKILFAIQWKTSAPTAWTFVQHFLAAAPQQQSLQSHQLLLKLAKHQTELTLVDYKYVTKSASSIAYASLANAVDMLQIPNPDFLNVLSILLEIDVEEVDQIRRDLMKQLRQQQCLQTVFSTKILRHQEVPKVRASAAGGHFSPREVCSVHP